MREGGQFEEEALVEALSEIVTFADRLREEVTGLLTSLLQFGFSKEAGVLQGQYEDVLRTVRQEMDTIWAPPGTHQAVESTRKPVRIGRGHASCLFSSICYV